MKRDNYTRKWRNGYGEPGIRRLTYEEVNAVKIMIYRCGNRAKFAACIGINRDRLGNILSQNSRATEEQLVIFGFEDMKEHFFRPAVRSNLPKARPDYCRRIRKGMTAQGGTR